MKPQLGQKIDLTIKRMGIYGEGVADWNGFTVFVDGALPGEEVTASMIEVRKTFGRARVVKIHRPSPHRVVPPCPVFGRCGGCQIMHLDYPEQLKEKRQRVVDALERIGKLSDVNVLPCVPSPEPFAYRNKIQLPVISDPHPRLGLYAFRSHDLVEIDRCYIHCDLGEKVFREVRQAVRASPVPSLRFILIKTAVQTGQVLVVFVTRDDTPLDSLAARLMASMPAIRGVVQNINPEEGNVILGSTYHTVAGQPFIEDQILGLHFKVSAASFFQVNPAQAENLYQRALENCHLKGDETVLDAYCGVGTLSLLLAQKAKAVIGVEYIPEAIADAYENSRLNGLNNTTFVCSPVEDFISTLSSVDVAVLNPPRKGCDGIVLEKLAALGPSRIVYISCDPATLARDLGYLKSQSYRIDHVEPFDMFPQTVHVEALVKLTKI